MTEEQERSQNGRSPLLFISGVIVLGFALALLLFGNQLFSEPEPTFQQIPSFDQTQSAVVQLPTGGGPIAVGELAQEFVVSDLAGNPISLSSYLGRPLILNFWATWCAPCRIEMPELQSAFVDYQEQDLTILALNQAETADLVSEFFYDEFDLTFTPLLDSDGLVSQQYGAVNLPTTIFINPEGMITAIHRGPVLREQLDDYLADVISEQ
ncbi:MAG: redoxin domain-containing protein [Chloroflexota bacterium]